MDSWEDGDGYEPYMGRWSRPIAREFVAWLDGARGERWLDVGCGTGALMSAVIDTARPGSVTGIDPSEEFLGTARRHIGDMPTLCLGDACDIPFPAAEFDIVVSGLVLNFVSDPQTAVQEMRRVGKGGRVAAYVWDYAKGMELIRYFWDVAIALDPGASGLDEAVRFPLCSPERLSHLFHQAGLENVDCRFIDVPTVFPNFDDFWAPFLLAQGPAPSYVASLAPAHVDQLRRALMEALPVADDGSVHLSARAWAVQGMAS